MATYLRYSYQFIQVVSKNQSFHSFECFRDCAGEIDRSSHAQSSITTLAYIWKLSNKFLILFTLTIILAVDVTSASALVSLEETHWLKDPIVVSRNVDGGNWQLAVSNDYVYVVWEDIGGITFVRSSDGGKSFSERVHLAEPQPADSSVAKNPIIAAYGDNVYIVYSSGFDIFLIRGERNGDSFREPVNVSRTSINAPYGVTMHVISVDGNNVYLAWTVGSGNWSEIYFARSTDGGVTFGPATNVSDTLEQDSSFPIITSVGNRVYLVWFDIDVESSVHHISFASSEDAGSSFHRVANFSRNNGYYNAFEPSLAANGDNVYIAWREETDGGPNIILAKSSDSGKKISYNEGMAPDGAWPSISVQGDNVYMLFGTQGNLSYDWAFTGSRDGGQTFSDPIMLGSYTWGLRPREDFWLPMMVADGANIHVVWKYYISNATDSEHDVFLVTSFDEGRNFTKPINLSQDTEGEVYWHPELVANADKLFVLWQEQASDYPDILLRAGQIPESYTEPFKQVSSTTPSESFNSTVLVASIAAIAIGVGFGTFHHLRKRTK